MPSKTKSTVNVDYNQFYWLSFVGATLCWGSYIPNILVGAHAYVGNTVMVTYLGYMLYFLIVTPILTALYLIIFYWKFISVHSPKADDAKAKWHAISINIREMVDYKYNFWTWIMLAFCGWAIQFSLYVYMAVGVTTGLSISSASPVDSIGPTGANGIYDDVFQLASLMTVLFYSFTFMLFANLHSITTLCAR